MPPVFPPATYPPPVDPGVPGAFPPPDSGGFVPVHAPFPSAPPPGRRRRGPIALAIVVVAVVGLVVLAFVLREVLNPAPVTPEDPTGTVAVTGGDIGTAIPLSGPDGTATVTVTGARWTPEGEVAPLAGTSYLIVDVELSGGTGEVAVGGMFTAVVTSDNQRFGLAFGPILDPLLASTVLRPGDSAAGQLGYQLPPGAVSLEFQSPDGVRLGAVRIPGP